MLQRIFKLYDKFTKYAVALAPIALLIIRLAWGWELFESGRGHLLNLDGPKGTVAFFASLNIPMPRANAIVCGSTEMIGGICWMFGFGTRLVSIPLFFNFCVAYVTASWPKVIRLFHHDPDPFIDDNAFPFLVCSLLFLAVGPGAISVDRIVRLIFKQGKPRPV